MKLSKKVKLVILILMSTTVYFIYNKMNYNNITYTAIGDGLSAGIDCYGQQDYGYSDYVKEYLKEKNKLKSYSKEYTSPDMTIESLHKMLLIEEKMESDYTKKSLKHLIRDTDYLTMTIGLNDLLYKMDSLNTITEDSINIILEDIEESFNSLIKEIRTIYPKTIYVIGYYDIDIENKNYKAAINKLNKIYKNNDDVVYISSYLLSENKSIFLSNPQSYYPNYKGYKAISTKIVEKMAKKLEK